MTGAEPLNLDERVRLRPLTLVEDGEDVLVGDPEAGTFVAMPPVGAMVIRLLQNGASLAEAATDAERLAGEPVDIIDFVAVLDELGFLDNNKNHDAPARTAPIQQRRWIILDAAKRAAPLFSPAAWVVYTVAFLVCVTLFVIRPDLWPRPSDVAFVDQIGVAIIALFPVMMLSAGLHESWHWLGACAAGLSARFGVDRRAYFLVYETDLSQLWTLPRRQRYGPQLAGLAIDSVVLAGLLIAQLVHQTGFVAALVFVKTTAILWQCMVFLRTDLYGVFVTATGCRNLWEVKSLLLRRAFGRLTKEQQDVLDAADPRDVQVGRWFRWVHLGGMAVLAGYFVLFFLPVLRTALAWTADGLASGVGASSFWLAAACALPMYFSPALALGLFVRERVRRTRRVTGPSTVELGG